jgi:hypothetical protein
MKQLTIIVGCFIHGKNMKYIYQILFMSCIISLSHGTFAAPTSGYVVPTKKKKVLPPGVLGCDVSSQCFGSANNVFNRPNPSVDDVKMAFSIMAPTFLDAGRLHPSSYNSQDFLTSLVQTIMAHDEDNRLLIQTALQMFGPRKTYAMLSIIAGVDPATGEIFPAMERDYVDKLLSKYVAPQEAFTALNVEMQKQKAHK